MKESCPSSPWLGRSDLTRAGTNSENFISSQKVIGQEEIMKALGSEFTSLGLNGSSPAETAEVSRTEIRNSKSSSLIFRSTLSLLLSQPSHQSLDLLPPSLMHWILTSLYERTSTLINQPSPILQLGDYIESTLLSPPRPRNLNILILLDGSIISIQFQQF